MHSLTTTIFKTGSYSGEVVWKGLTRRTYLEGFVHTLSIQVFLCSRTKVLTTLFGGDIVTSMLFKRFGVHMICQDSQIFNKLRNRLQKQ